jgi:hypothetical protein
MYFRFIGQNYLNNTLSPLIKKIVSSKKAYEVHFHVASGRIYQPTNQQVDPEKMDRLSKSKQTKTIQSNLKHLQQQIERALEAIFSSVDHCPA